jgi:hypothetical protein
MALQIIQAEPVSTPYVVLEEKLWLTADRDRVVKDGDPEARFLLGTPGKRVSVDEAERLGLTGKKPASQSKADEDTDEGPDDASLEDLTVEQLQARLKKAELPVSGKKQDLVDRLEEHAKSKAPAEDKSRKPEGDK